MIAVGNGADAIERAQRDRPDIVLADVGMPERDGYEVAHHQRDARACAHPVVLLTGAFEPVDEDRARAVGCDGVLVKPFEPQLVISRVKDLLAGKRPSGMWGSGPVAQGPVRQAAAAPDAAARGVTAPGAPGDSLEAYFDHLDAAFAGSGDAPGSAAARAATEPVAVSRGPAAAPPAGARSNDPFADWDPDLQGDPARPAPQRGFADAAPQATPPPAYQSAPIATAPPAAVSPEPRGAAGAPAPVQIPSLVDAFAALLSAEQKTGLAPSGATAAPMASSAAPPVTPTVTDDMIETIPARVLARLSDESRPSLLDVAEPLVRQGSERIKSTG